MKEKILNIYEGRNIFYIYENNGEEYDGFEDWAIIVISKDIENAKIIFWDHIKKSYRKYRKNNLKDKYQPNNIKDYINTFYRWWDFPDWERIIIKTNIIENKIISIISFNKYNN